MHHLIFQFYILYCLNIECFKNYVKGVWLGNVCTEEHNWNFNDCNFSLVTNLNQNISLCTDISLPSTQDNESLSNLILAMQINKQRQIQKKVFKEKVIFFKIFVMPYIWFYTFGSVPLFEVSNVIRQLVIFERFLLSMVLSARFTQ